MLCAFRHSSESKSMLKRMRLFWLPLAVAALTLMVVLVRADANAAGAVLSQGRPAHADSACSGHRPRAANDGSLGSSWMARRATYPKSWTVDLGAKRRLGQVAVYWETANNRVYGYRILGSNNRTVWTVLKNRAANSTSGVTSDNVSGRYRYVRIKVLSSTYGRARIHEVRVYAGSAPPPVTPMPTVAYNVMDYGAHADGVTDDRSAITACANAAVAGGGHVYFPPGTYRLSGSMTAVANAYYYAPTGVILRNAGITAASGCTFDGFSLPSYGANNGIMIGARNSTTTVHDVTIKNCSFSTGTSVRRRGRCVGQSRA